jgi:hypothetical protein
MTSNSVLQLLQEDRELRIKARTDNCDDCLLRTTRGETIVADWDFSMPTVPPRLPHDCRSLIQAATYLLEKAPFLKLIDMDNLLLAGGACQQALTGTIEEDTDYDFFLVGIKTPKLANDRIRKFFRDISARYVVSAAVRTGSALTYIVRDVTSYTTRHTIQFILRLYDSPSQVLLGFDMGSCAVGYDGTDFLFTPLSQFAYSMGHNIVDPLHRSTTYERRLAKYWRRGFGIIMPHLGELTVQPQPTWDGLRTYANAGQFTLVNPTIEGNRLTTEFLNFGPCPLSDYSSHCDFMDSILDSQFGYYLDHNQTYHTLLTPLVRGNPLIYTKCREDDEYSLYGPIPGITTGITHGFTHPGSLKAAIDRVFMSTFPPHCQVFQNIKLAAVVKFLSAEDVLVLVNHVKADEFDEARAALELMKARLLATCKSNLEGVDHITIPWITDNPGGQGNPLLTGSFHPATMELGEWYGDQLLIRLPEARVAEPTKEAAATSVATESETRASTIQDLRVCLTAAVSHLQNLEKALVEATGELAKK